MVRKPLFVAVITNTTLDFGTKLPDITVQPKQNALFSIPDLPFGPSETLPAPIPSTTTECLPEPAVEIGEVDDIWLLPEETPLKTANYESWDSFDVIKNRVPHKTYITEAGSSVFDAAVSANRDYLHVGNSGDAVIGATVYAASLLALGLGRNSVLFTWNEEKQSFGSSLPRMRIPGYTAESLEGLSSIFMDCGKMTKFLQSFVRRAYTKKNSPGQIALADAVSNLLRTIQSDLSESASENQSILQLQVLFGPVHSILTCFQRMVKNVSASRNDESMLSTIFEEIQLLEHRTDSLREILIEILSRVSLPWLEFTCEWLGLRRQSGLPVTKEGNGKSFVNVTNREWIDDRGIELQQRDYVLDYDRVPSFISPEDARTMFEVGRSLRFLMDHHPDHPLAKADVIASAKPPSLEWKFSWQDIVAVEAKALQYEKDLTTAIRRFTKDSSLTKTDKAEHESRDAVFQLDFFGKPEEDMQAHVLASIDAFNVPLKQNIVPDRLSDVLHPYLSSYHDALSDDASIFSPPISMTPLLAFNPLIAAQARIVNGTCMRMFFNSHNLREHLALQRSFHLFGNGVFSSKLSHALFDPELESAERHRGVARSGGLMGLRLGGRDTWPPASFELRLALMGVLTESYVSTNPSYEPRGAGYLETSLPGDISFALRDMSEEEIEKCMNADAIEALDFLRLSYKPPPPLEAVITPIILFKYDQIFKLLLRVIRMLYVVSALFRDATDRTSYWQGIDYVAQRFRIEAHHFVSSVSGYFFDTGIEATWRVFERKLDQVESRINGDENITLGQHEGLDKLRDYHERMVDRIMFALLLRKRQQPVMQLLQEIFGLILQFSKHSRQRALGIKRKVGADDEVRAMYRGFRKKVEVFISVCRGLSDKKEYGVRLPLDGRKLGGESLFDPSDLAEENTIGHLLARLEMSNYYSKTVDA
jgi:hypothetical protein